MIERGWKATLTAHFSLLPSLLPGKERTLKNLTPGIETMVITESGMVSISRFPARFHVERLRPGLFATNVAETYPSLTSRSGKLAL